MSSSSSPKMKTLVNNVTGVLYSYFISDSLCMPTHWFYQISNIKKIWGESGLTYYDNAPSPHPEAFLLGSAYSPVEISPRNNPKGRPADIVHEHAKYYKINNSEYKDRSFQPESSVQRDSHGNSLHSSDSARPHYHEGLKAGENTVQAHIIRVFLRNIIKNKGYDQDAWLNDFIQYFLTKGNNKDPYLEVAIRKFFENYSLGLPLHSLATRQRDTWSTGNCSAMASTMMFSLLYPNFIQRGIARAFEHQALLYRSEQVMLFGSVLLPLLNQLIHLNTNSSDNDYSKARELILESCKSIHAAKISGADLLQLYRDRKGPGNISKAETWQLHNQLQENSIYEQLIGFLNDNTTSNLDEIVVVNTYGSACYIEEGVCGAMYLALKYNFDLERALLVNANLGGDTTGRGAVLAILIGAVIGGNKIPKKLIEGLKDNKEISQEIDQFVQLAVKGNLAD